MSLASLLSEENGPLGRSQCTVGRLLSDMSPEDAAALTDALAGPMPGTAIARALCRLPDVRIEAQTVQRHRKNDCRCSRT